MWLRSRGSLCDEKKLNKKMAKVRIRRHERTIPDRLKTMPCCPTNKEWFKELSEIAMDFASVVEYSSDLLPGRHYIVCMKKNRLLFVHRASGRIMSRRDVDLSNTKLTANNTTISGLLQYTNAVLEVFVHWIKTIDKRGKGGIKLEYDILDIVQPKNSLKNVEYISNEVTGNKLVFRDENINEWHKSMIIDVKSNKPAIQYRNWNDIPSGEYVIWGCFMEKLFKGAFIIIVSDMGGKFWYSHSEFLKPLLHVQIDGKMSFTEALVRDDTTVQVFWDEDVMEITAVNSLRRSDADRKSVV